MDDRLDQRRALPHGMLDDVYDQLRALAAAYAARERHKPAAASLVHDALLRVGSPSAFDSHVQPSAAVGPSPPPPPRPPAPPPPHDQTRPPLAPLHARPRPSPCARRPPRPRVRPGPLRPRP